MNWRAIGPENLRFEEILLAADVAIPPPKGNVFPPFTMDQYGTDTILPPIRTIETIF
ncbi:hypothetical protein IVA80_12585 [Bradyrhizobium sp. 139]|uniref:hypothetical protein n=1 Tax=Bradyrhizobium sp. 139 TaxID=2782616 RepID=UPI001FF74FC6|nr:hypothetical protein [Bradyrhizobium sp. 139]MCK1741685.1 hypothetical protein [Bradyrhizobium sp. 139]